MNYRKAESVGCFKENMVIKRCSCVDWCLFCFIRKFCATNRHNLQVAQDMVEHILKISEVLQVYT
jgi:hypothetical protein